MRISVVIPTYRRERQLLRCLSALEHQTVLPHEVVVVCRAGDEKTCRSVCQWSTVSSVYRKGVILVDTPGQVHALKVGSEMCSGEVVAFTDDDAEPHKNWIEYLSLYYLDPTVGGVGGRDIIHDGGQYAPGNYCVGQLLWYGRLLGNHHLGTGGARYVDVLKGVNMSFRKEVLQFPEYLRGVGAQIHNELGVCLRIRRLGYKLVYDPQILVDHYPAPRFDKDQRGDLVLGSIRDAAFNQTVSVTRWLPWYRSLIHIIYVILVGGKGSPGALRFIMGLLRREKPVIYSYIPAQIGQFLGILYHLLDRFRVRRTETL